MGRAHRPDARTREGDGRSGTPDPATGGSGALPFQEGEDVAIAFRIAYNESGAPLPRANLAGWVIPRPAGTTTDGRTSFKQLESLMSRSVFTRAPLDLTSYEVLTLNHDTVAVIDPLFGFGGTKLLALLPLRGVAFDWRLAADERRLFVSVPDAGRVAVIDTETRTLLPEALQGALPPGSLNLQPDGAYLWVAEGEDPAGRIDSGVAVVDPITLDLVKRIPTGKGPHRLVFDSDGHVFVTNAGAGTVSVIDATAWVKLADVPTGTMPGAIDFSARAQLAYVAHPDDGNLVAVDGRRGAVAARLRISPGSNRIRFAPGGRFGLLVSPEDRTVSILDVAVNRVVKQARFDQEPESVACSRQFAYIQHRGGPSLTAIPLAELDKPGPDLPIAEIPIGRSPFSHVEAETPADRVAQVPGGDAVLISHAFDQSIYFLKEGMSAPMGEARNYGGQPRAVLVVDRSLAERTRPGLYETFGRLPDAGSYDVLFFLESPRIVHSFPIEIAPHPELARRRQAGKFDLEWISAGSSPTVGQSCSVALSLTDRLSRAPRTDRDQLLVTVFLAPGTWHRRFAARHRGEGIYVFAFTPPQEGIYYLNLQDPTPPDDLGSEKTLILQAVPDPGPH
jgi:YVTN family beta-propeller protein